MSTNIVPGMKVTLCGEECEVKHIYHDGDGEYIILLRTNCHENWSVPVRWVERSLLPEPANDAARAEVSAIMAKYAEAIEADPPQVRQVRHKDEILMDEREAMKNSDAKFGKVRPNMDNRTLDEIVASDNPPGSWGHLLQSLLKPGKVEGYSVGGFDLYTHNKTQAEPFGTSPPETQFGPCCSVVDDSWLPMYFRGQVVTPGSRNEGVPLPEVKTGEFAQFKAGKGPQSIITFVLATGYVGDVAVSFCSCDKTRWYESANLAPIGPNPLGEIRFQDAKGVMHYFGRPYVVLENGMKVCKDCRGSSGVDCPKCTVPPSPENLRRAAHPTAHAPSAGVITNLGFQAFGNREAGYHERKAAYDAKWRNGEKLREAMKNHDAKLGERKLTEMTEVTFAVTGTLETYTKADTQSQIANAFTCGNVVIEAADTMTTLSIQEMSERICNLPTVIEDDDPADDCDTPIVREG